MAEEMVYNWLDIAMYSYVSEESISCGFYDLHKIIRHIIECGAVEQVTGRSQYTINMDNVLQVSLSQDKIVSILVLVSLIFKIFIEIIKMHSDMTNFF